MKSRHLLLFATTLAFAALYCLALYYLRDKGILLTMAGMGFLVAIYLTFKRSDVVLGIVVAIIGLCPFFVSVGLGPGMPKAYGEDLPVIYYMAYMLVVYGFLRQKRFHLGNTALLILFCIFVIAAIVPFFTEPVARSAMRNFTETFILGFTLYLIFFNESDADNIDTLMLFVAGTALCIAAFICVEAIMKANPLMEKAQKVMEGFIYVDPSQYRFLDSYYRPYAVFFHPSEAGTFLAMGLPFVSYAVRGKRPLLKYAALGLMGAGIVLNYTRGVWVALALTLVISNYRRVRRYLPMAAAAGVLALGLSSMTMGDTPFIKRIFDPANLYNRLYYWKVGMNIVSDYFPFGIGHMNFENRYLEFVDTEPAPAGLDVQQIFVADNIFLTTLVEHGFLGFLAQMVFYVAAIVMTARLARTFRLRGDAVNAARLSVFSQALLVYLLAGFFADVQLFAKVSKLFFIALGMAFAVARFAGEPRPMDLTADKPKGYPGLAPEGGRLNPLFDRPRSA